MINFEVSHVDSNTIHSRDSKESFNTSPGRQFDSVQTEAMIPTSPESESAYLVHFWSNLPSLSSFVSTFVKPTISETSKVIDKLRSDEDGSQMSVPMKTFSGTTKTTTSLSGVVARPKDFLTSDNVAATVTDSKISGEVSTPVYSQRNESKVTINSTPEVDQFEFANVENNSSRRRRRARRRLQHGGVFSSFTGWLPNLFQSSPSVSSPGFVQQLVLQALLSPSSQPTSDASDAMGRRLYALMTSSTLTSGGYNNNLLASQFRPKLTNVTDDEASGDFDLMNLEDKKAALLVEMGPIRPNFVPRITLASRTR